MPILETHAPDEPIRNWRGFLVHIATITIGLLIAIALEQGVEYLHHVRQRHQLQHDLHEEAQRNRDILEADLGLASQSDWFRAVLEATKLVPSGGQISINLPPMPCIPGTLAANGTDAAIRTSYFSPSDAVWATARDAELIIRLPVDEARMYTRLAHNYALQQAARDRFAYACERIDSLHTRYASAAQGKTGDVWVLSQGQAREMSEAAATADSALRGLMWRTRWNLRFEEGILRGATNYDEVLMNLAGPGR
jgi:hypothetical protein